MRLLPQVTGGIQRDEITAAEICSEEQLLSISSISFERAVVVAGEISFTGSSVASRKEVN